jgi:hypothetical protein
MDMSLFIFKQRERAKTKRVYLTEGLTLVYRVDEEDSVDVGLFSHTILDQTVSIYAIKKVYGKGRREA